MKLISKTMVVSTSKGGYEIRCSFLFNHCLPCKLERVIRNISLKSICAIISLNNKINIKVYHVLHQKYKSNIREERHN